MAETDRPAPVHQDARKWILWSWGTWMFKLFLCLCVQRSISLSFVLRFYPHNPPCLSIMCSPCFSAGFDECNWRGAEGSRGRGCNTPRNHHQPAPKTQTDTGPVLWWHTPATHACTLRPQDNFILLTLCRIDHIILCDVWGWITKQSNPPSRPLSCRKLTSCLCSCNWKIPQKYVEAKYNISRKEP